MLRQKIDKKIGQRTSEVFGEKIEEIGESVGKENRKVSEGGKTS